MSEKLKAIRDKIAKLEAEEREIKKAELVPMKEQAQKAWASLSALVGMIKETDSLYTAPWDRKKSKRVDSAIQQFINLDSSSGVTEDEIIIKMKELGYNDEKVKNALKNRLDKWWIKKDGKYWERTKTVVAPVKKNWTPPVKK